MRRIPVESSVIHSVAYASNTQVLEVVFLSGASYKYKDVHPVVFAKLLGNPSVGKTFNKIVKGKFPYSKAKTKVRIPKKMA